MASSVKVTSAVAARSPQARATFSIVAPTSAAPAPEDRSTSPIRRERSRVLYVSLLVSLLSAIAAQVCRGPRAARDPNRGAAKWLCSPLRRKCRAVRLVTFCLPGQPAGSVAHRGETVVLESERQHVHVLAPQEPPKDWKLDDVT